MIDDEDWEASKSRFPIGSEVSVVVRQHMPFGMFVELPADPTASAFIDLASYHPGGQEVVDHTQWPSEGEAIDAIVADHVDRNRQIRLRVGPEIWH